MVFCIYLISQSLERDPNQKELPKHPDWRLYFEKLLSEQVTINQLIVGVYGTYDAASYTSPTVEDVLELYELEQFIKQNILYVGIFLHMAVLLSDSQMPYILLWKLK